MYTDILIIALYLIIPGTLLGLLTAIVERKPKIEDFSDRYQHLELRAKHLKLRTEHKPLNLRTKLWADGVSPTEYLTLRSKVDSARGRHLGPSTHKRAEYLDI